MNLFKILKKVGAGIVRNAVPGGGMIIDTVNAMLPDDKKLPAEATGADMEAVIETLPADQRAAILDKKFDVDITQIKESNSTLRAMLSADATMAHTTRPLIALGSFWVVAFVALVAIGMWAYGIGAGKPDMVKAVTGGWPFVAAVVGPFITLLWAYFGVLKQEHKNKLDAAGGASVPSGIVGLLSMLRK